MGRPAAARRRRRDRLRRGLGRGDPRHPHRRPSGSGIAAKVGAWIDECADKGFEAVEPDNYDTFTRAPDNLLSAGERPGAHPAARRPRPRRRPGHRAEEHRELAGNRVAERPRLRGRRGVRRTGSECGDYTTAFGNNVIVIEYTEEGLEQRLRRLGRRAQHRAARRRRVHPGQRRLRLPDVLKPPRPSCVGALGRWPRAPRWPAAGPTATPARTGASRSSFWHGQTDTALQVIEGLVADFERTHPNDPRGHGRRRR